MTGRGSAGRWVSLSAILMYLVLGVYFIASYGAFDFDSRIFGGLLLGYGAFRAYRFFGKKTSGGKENNL